MPEGLQLPACQKCKFRKVRCDREAPKCGNCSKGHIACIIVDPETGEQYARDYLRQLEEEEVRLKKSLGEGTNATTSETPFVEDVASTQRSASESESSSSQNCFVGDGSGLGFLYSILSDARWQQIRALIRIQLAARPRVQGNHLVSNAFPPLHEAKQLLENYFTRFHIHHTFLLRQEVLSIFNSIYSASSIDNDVSAQERFRLLMVFAISATTRHRAGLSDKDPYGYFVSAWEYLRSISLIQNLDAIQNLLLVARFGMYHHIGISLWEISQLCMRQCIEWNLHICSDKALNPLAEQHRRRVFWECYILDRYSSGILGRPFAIQESEISVPLPIDADDEMLVVSTETSLDRVLPNTSSCPSELSVFIHCIKLRQISSRIHTDLYTGPGIASQARGGNGSCSLVSRFKTLGHLYSCFSRFRAELGMWRTTAPIFQDPRSLYERPEWHEFLYQKDLMLLARGFMHNVPSPSVGGVTLEIFTTCYQSASQVIELYADLMDKQAITWTRSYFQVIFTAGLTVIYCMNLDVVKCNMDDRDPFRVLAQCNNILTFFKEKMLDAASFALVFQLLKDECIKNRLHTGDSGRDVDMAAITREQHTPVQGENGIDNPSFIASTGLDTNHYNPYDSEPQYNLGTHNFGFGSTDGLDLITQLEAGLGEYAWGWIPMDTNFLDQGLFS